MEYKENEVLTNYVWKHYEHLLSKFECRVGKAIFLRQKIDVSSDPKSVRAAFGKEDPQIVSALKDGVETFRQNVSERILLEHADAVFINRCPKCEKIVRTPQAELCLWCGHSWHAKK